MKTIFKYALDIEDEQTIAMPQNALLLDIQVQDNKVCIWASVRTEESLVDRTFLCFGTGHTLPDEDVGLLYVGTVQLHGLVWHYFEVYDTR